MKTMNFEQMEQVNGGSFFGKFMCNAATGGIGGVYGAALSAGLAGTSLGPAGTVIGVVFGIAWGAGLNALVC